MTIDRGDGGAAAGTAAAAFDQTTSVLFAVAGGTVDALTAAFTPTITTLTDGMLLRVRAAGANATTTPTLNVDGRGANTIVREGGAALRVGDIGGADHVCLFSYDLVDTRWELLNPAHGRVHASDATGAHAASAIANTPAGNIAATTVQAAIDELDTEKQPLDATLTALAGVTVAADKLVYATGADTFATTDFTAFSRTILDDANAATVLATLGVGQWTAWTPVLTFETPGNLSVVYTTQVGRASRIGNVGIVTFSILTSTFTHTTASGKLLITGSPFTSVNVEGVRFTGGLTWRGITKANFTDIVARIVENVSTIDFGISGSGQAADLVDAADMPTGGVVTLQGTITYEIA